MCKIRLYKRLKTMELEDQHYVLVWWPHVPKCGPQSVEIRPLLAQVLRSSKCVPLLDSIV